MYKSLLAVLFVFSATSAMELEIAYIDEQLERLAQIIAYLPPISDKDLNGLMINTRQKPKPVKTSKKKCLNFFTATCPKCSASFGGANRQKFEKNLRAHVKEKHAIHEITFSYKPCKALELKKAGIQKKRSSHRKK